MRKVKHRNICGVTQRKLSSLEFALSLIDGCRCLELSNQSICARRSRESIGSVRSGQHKCVGSNVGSTHRSSTIDDGDLVSRNALGDGNLLSCSATESEDFLLTSTILVHSGDSNGEGCLCESIIFR